MKASHTQPPRARALALRTQRHQRGAAVEGRGADLGDLAVFADGQRRKRGAAVEGMDTDLGHRVAPSTSAFSAATSCH